MVHRFRGAASAILTLILVLGLASPAGAGTALGRDHGDMESSVPVVFDVVVLRPLGLAMMALGTVFYAAPVLPLTLITRPTDVGKPFRLLVITPAKFTFVDPLGQH